MCKEILTTCSGAAEDNQEDEKETDDDDAVFTKGISSLNSVEIYFDENVLWLTKSHS